MRKSGHKILEMQDPYIQKLVSPKDRENAFQENSHKEKVG